MKQHNKGQQITKNTTYSKKKNNSCSYIFIDSLQGTASEATVMAILAAKMKSIREIQQKESERDQYEIMSKLVAYCSEQVRLIVEGTKHEGSFQSHHLLKQN